MASTLPTSGRGVMSASTRGLPMTRLSVARAKASRNFSRMSLCTYTTFKAVHRWPLKLHAPLTHSFTANSRSASGKTTAGFLASNPSTCRTRLGLGCCEIKALLLLLLPMRASTSTRPDFMMGLARVRPRPNTMLTTPGGKLSANASSRGTMSKTPYLAGLNTHVLPIKMAGNSTQNVSFKG